MCVTQKIHHFRWERRQVQCQICDKICFQVLQCIFRQLKFLANEVDCLSTRCWPHKGLCWYMPLHVLNSQFMYKSYQIWEGHFRQQILFPWTPSSRGISCFSAQLSNILFLSLGARPSLNPAHIRDIWSLLQVTIIILGREKCLSDKAISLNTFCNAHEFSHAIFSYLQWGILRPISSSCRGQLGPSAFTMVLHFFQGPKPIIGSGQVWVFHPLQVLGTLFHTRHFYCWHIILVFVWTFFFSIKQTNFVFQR